MCDCISIRVTCIKTGFNCSLPPVSHHLSFCFLPRDVEWKADENNLHAGERKRERERQEKKERRRSKTLRWEVMMQVRGKMPNTPG